MHCNNGLNNKLVETLVENKVAEETGDLKYLQDSMYDFVKTLKEIILGEYSPEFFNKYVDEALKLHGSNLDEFLKIPKMGLELRQALESIDDAIDTSNQEFRDNLVQLLDKFQTTLDNVVFEARSPYEIAVKYGFVGTEEEWLSNILNSSETAHNIFQDAKTFADFLYKPVDFMVARRLAPSVHTLDYYLDSFDNEVGRVANKSNEAITSINAVVDTVNDEYNSSQVLLNNVYDKYNEAIDTVNNLEPMVVGLVNTAIDSTAIEGGVLTDTFLTATTYHSDTYARTQRSVRADNVSLLDFIPLALHAGITSYAFTDDVSTYVQKAVDYCVLNNKELNVPAGGYLLGSSINIVNHWGADRNLIFTGAGLGLTVFREVDGKTNAIGRYSKMFYLNYGSSSFTGDFGHVKFSGMTLDKNGRSNTNDLGLFHYEQAHTIAGAGSGSSTIKSIQLENIEFIDKIGAGFNLSSSPNVKIGKVLVSNLISRNHPKVTRNDGGGDRTFGQRGCLELGTNIGTVDIVNCDVLYAQIEPVIASSPTMQRFANVSGGKIDAFEWTDKGGYSFANVVNLTCSNKFLVRGINAHVTNSTLKIRENITEGIVKITGGTILLDYNAETNVLTPLLHGTASGYLGYGELWLSNLDIRIDNPDPNLLPEGTALSGGSTGLKGSRKRFLNNVKFDPRIAYSIAAYGNGDWKIANSDLYGKGRHLTLGGIGDIRGGSVELINNNYMGEGMILDIYRNNDLWDLKVHGQYPLANFYTTTGSIPYRDIVVQKPLLTSSTRPSTEVAPLGQEVLNTAPVVGGYERWIKIADANTSSSWKGVGLIEGDAVVAARTSGTTSQRPTGVAVGFTYFDTTLGKPVYFKSTGVWVDSTGATV